MELEIIFKESFEKIPVPVRSQPNYCAIFGTLPDQLVDEKSNLAMELIQLFVIQMINIRQEISIPDCFIDFRGENMKNAVQNETSRYALGFGDKSKFDETTLEIFKEFAAKSTGKLFNE